MKVAKVVKTENREEPKVEREEESGLDELPSRAIHKYLHSQLILASSHSF